jgi:hypothetical protein
MNCMGQVEVKWNTTASGGHRSECGKGGRYGAQREDRGVWEAEGLDVV